MLQVFWDPRTPNMADAPPRVIPILRIGIAMN